MRIHNHRGCEVLRFREVLRGFKRFRMMSVSVLRCDVACRDMLWRGVAWRCLVWCGVALLGAAGCGAVWCGVGIGAMRSLTISRRSVSTLKDSVCQKSKRVVEGLSWHDMTWYGMVWYGLGMSFAKTTIARAGSRSRSRSRHSASTSGTGSGRFSTFPDS